VNEVKKQGQSMWINETKASAKITRSKLTKTSQSQAKSMTTEILRRRLPNDLSVNNNHPKSTDVNKSTEP
jgi:hypothetical protein